YIPQSNSPATPAMTCAGLIGLAVSHGQALGRVGPRLDLLTKDVNVKAGLMAVAAMIGGPAEGDQKVVMITAGTRNYYFLWTLERMAVLFDLKTIGNKDWYVWGAQLLVASQGQDGG